MTELDDYGFERDHSIPRDVYEDYKQEYQKILRHRESRWSKTKLTDQKRLIKSKRLKSFCRKGIPRKHRIQVWMHLSEAQYEMDHNRNLFKELLSREVSHKFKSVIDVDLRRTFPENHYFKESDTEESMIRNLANVLYAFANKNPEIGYCQGLNFVAATLLLAFDEDEKDIIKEEKTFWLLNQLVEKILPGYYGNNMLDLSRDCMVLEELLEDRMSDISKLLRQSQIEMTMIAPKWFICCFADVVPIETVFRIFDCLFYEGDKILFRAALTLIKTHKDELLERRDLPSVMRKFKEIGKDKETLYCHEFIKNMFSMNKGLKRKDIERYRNKTRELLTYSRSLKIETLGRYSSLDRDISSS